MNLITNPAEIEQRSFEIISEKLAGRELDPMNAPIIKRVIHTTADFDYFDNLIFSKDAVAIAQDAIRQGANIVTDTQMAKAGINKKAAAQFACDIHCFIGDPQVHEASQAQGITRAQVAVDWAAEALSNPLIFVVGNAPTALIRLHELITKKGFAPNFIVAAPVGFVNVVESKELILDLSIPHIVARGQKGGSNVAAAICNALLYNA